MAGQASPPSNRNFRETVRFYLLNQQTAVGKAINVLLLALDLVFITIFVLQTYSLRQSLQRTLWHLEVTIALIFLGEYLLRIYGAEQRLEEARNLYTMVDLVTILPTLSAVVLSATVAPTGLGALRVLGVIRILRFYRFTREQQFFFGTVSAGTLRATKLLLTVLAVFFIFAGLFYGVEHTTNPGVTTFGDAFYFMVVTLTTVGFGDITPVTKLGRWVTVAAILTGIIVIPWQARRIIRQWTGNEKVPTDCPNCDQNQHDADATYCKTCGHSLNQDSHTE